jgi:tetratricopeptide (TPR) repeat protein
MRWSAHSRLTLKAIFCATIYRRAIEIGEKVLGKDHPNVATWYNNLALLLKVQGKYDQADPLYRRAIEINEKVLGKDHPTVATNYNNLAGLLHDQGKFDQAEVLYRQAIEIFQTKLGPDHPNTLATKKGYDSLRKAKQNSEKPAR